MSIYHFTIVVRDANSNLADLEDQFFEVGCEDALLCEYNDTIYLEFDRESDQAIHAIQSALDEIKSLGFKDLIVEEQGFSTLSEMAERAGMSRQALSLYAQNKRGNGNFPKPMYGLASKSAMYLWSEVATWLFQQGKLDQAQYEVATVNI